jgi:D-arabinose 1-dehydrogenase-like Zn-dependent alcohol dehydrogenase
MARKKVKRIVGGEELVVEFNGELDNLRASITLLQQTVSKLIQTVDKIEGRDDINMAGAIAKSQEVSASIINQNQKIDQMMKYFIDESGEMKPLSKIIDNKFEIFNNLVSELPCRAGKKK